MLAALQPRWQRWLARRIPAASSVTLNQRRIFIVPSATGGAFALVLLLMLLAGELGEEFGIFLFDRIRPAFVVIKQVL